MKISFVGKYPPIMGGESTKLYWLARGLGERGHEIFLVSDCQERVLEGGLSLDDLDHLQPENVKLYSTSNLNVTSTSKDFRTERLANLTIRVVAERDPDLMVGWYLLPYSSAAFLASRMTNKPFVVQHAGSDMKRLFHNKNLKAFFLNMFHSADGIMSYPSYFNLFNQVNSCLLYTSPSPRDS